MSNISLSENKISPPSKINAIHHSVCKSFLSKSGRTDIHTLLVLKVVQRVAPLFSYLH